MCLYTGCIEQCTARGTCKEDGKDDGQLVDGMTNDVLHHRPRDQRLRASVRLAFQHLLRRQLSGQRQRRQRVHDQVDPQHLDGFQRRVLTAQTRDSGQTALTEVPASHPLITVLLK